MRRALLRLALVSTMVGGCCTAQVSLLEKDGPTDLIVATSSEESCAYEKARDKGKEFCAKKRKRFVVVKDQSEYRGMDRNTKGVMRGVSAVLGTPNGDSPDDYRIRIEFKCK